MSITIVMCSWNNERTIEEAIKSVLDQSFASWKLIVIDAHSSDGSLQIVDSLASTDSRIIVIPKISQDSWSYSIAEIVPSIDSEYFMLLDGDDYISKDYLEALIGSLQGTDAIGAFGKGYVLDFSGREYRLHISNDRRYGFTSSPFRFFRLAVALLIPESLGLVNLIYGVWKTDVFKEFVQFRELFAATKDWPGDYDRAFILECLETGRITSVIGPCLYKRLKIDIPISDKEIRIGRYRNVRKTSFWFFSIFSLYVLAKPPYARIYEWISEKSKRFIFIPIYSFRVLIWQVSTPLRFFYNLKRRH